MKAVKVFVGATLGLVVGAILGSIAALLQFRLLHPVPANGLVAVMVVRFPIFWAVLLLCVIGFGYLFSRIGHRRHPSHV